ncbi:tRNA-(MS[2]IO[6]A)-hydroxylase (MiaE)-like [Sanguibacter gelidistatuariae]|uniref:tRNA-(MS[2]IO[6]A)-hydroxylase (MiaE)-like n=1 Tax=Sanguibacter gelidistatuariae TaxID=1814289 RepID=A0A1G6L1M8_9MICO|nr:ferritin-like fold-containing protein [Sanguibacter gelidistatuariae]SDC37001.1 tRNA-(MS[2]IO[6]A)-hydroxylase (MiaE)-like [Sanguibacter gelidistatuariae]
MSDTLELLGFIAYTELTTFTRLAGAATTAPTPEHQLRLVRLAGDAVSRMERILARIGELDGDPDAQLLAFDGTFDDYNARTVPGTWWENLLKGYVGNGVADDFCRIAVDGLDAQTRALVIEVLDDNRNAEMSVRVLADAASGDAVLASRLALWGRRLVGDALGLLQNLATRNDALGRLVLDGARQRAGAADVDQSWVFAQLTAEHTRRMGRLGLAA